MGNLTIRRKLLALFFLAFFTCIAIIGVSIKSLHSLANMEVHKAEELLLEGQKEKIKVATTSMANTLAKAVDNVSSEEEKLTIFRNLIQNTFFESDRSGYYFIYEGTTNVAHPVKPALHGKDLKGLKGKDGVYSVRELAKAATSGGDFVNFTWDKPGKSEPVAKLGYAIMIPGTNYWIGTGVYIDNIQEQTGAIKETMEDETMKAIIIQTVAAVALCLLVLLPLSLLVSRNIINPIIATKEAAEKIAEGELDITIEASHNDELGALQASLSTMAKSLKDNIDELKRKEKEADRKASEAEQASAAAKEANAIASEKTTELLEAADELDKVVDSVSAAAEHLSSQIEQSRAGAQEQADRVDSTATTMNEMSSTVLEIARNAGDAAHTVDQARDMAEDGANVVLRVVDGIDDVAAKAEMLRKDMGNLGHQAENIGVIINVINDIADQTNLLALNAAIEAARAGEAGRGFAVVADEVRKLAEKTVTATSDVTNAIKDIQEATNKNINNSVQSVEVIANVTDLANESGESLRQIVSLVNDASTQVQSIAAASEEHSTASEEVNQSIIHISEISVETANAMDSSKTVVLDLAELVKTLTRLTDRMKA